jgi:hypothetical protein
LSMPAGLRSPFRILGADRQLCCDAQPMIDIAYTTCWIGSGESTFFS